MSSTKSQLSELESLPTELLIQIFNVSYNPNLIFVSRRFHSLTAYESICQDLAWQICNNASDHPHRRCRRCGEHPVSIDAILTFDDFAREDWLTIAHVTDAALQWMKKLAIWKLTWHLNNDHFSDTRSLLESDPAALQHFQQTVRDPEIAKLKSLLSTHLSRSSLAAAVGPHISYLQSVQFFTHTTMPHDPRRGAFTIKLLWPPAVATGSEGWIRWETWDFLSMYVQHHLPHPVLWFEMMDRPVNKAGRFWHHWKSRASSNQKGCDRSDIRTVEIELAGG